jgi:hypothetical protein
VRDIDYSRYVSFRFRPVRKFVSSLNPARHSSPAYKGSGRTIWPARPAVDEAGSPR